MKRALISISRRLWPDFDALPQRDRLQLLAELTGILYSLPLAILSAIWLLAASDFARMSRQWPALLLFLGLGYLLMRLPFYQLINAGDGTYGFNSSSLLSLLLVAAALLLGPNSAWLLIVLTLVYYAVRYPGRLSRYQRWNWLRNLVYNLWSGVAALLLSIALYQRLGGQIPLPDLSPANALPALVAVAVYLASNTMFFYGMGLVQTLLIQQYPAQKASRFLSGTARFFLLSEVPAFFGILAAAVYSQMGLPAFLVLMIAVLMVSYLARRLSQAAILAQQRSREVEQLERLGQAIIASPADGLALPDLLKDFVPRMLDFRQIEISLFAGPTLLRMPSDRPPLAEFFCPWLREHPASRVFRAGDRLPWADAPARDDLVLVPIVSPEAGQYLGGICLVQDASYAVELETDLRPALQSLAAQIAGALHSVEVYQRTLAHQKVAQELAFAGQIQASFLPESLPQVPGWQLTATLQPARETSGDFYDAILLPNGKLGLLVADVADKGMGAALYMALSRTLLRTYAYEYHDRPDFVLRVANRRILADAQGGLFVSVFYAVLDPFKGSLAYANAGHNPAYLFCRQEATGVATLHRTGMVLGVMEGMSWEQRTVNLEPGDMLVLYSDGITDAQDEKGEFFGEKRLQGILNRCRGWPAEEIQGEVLAAVSEFTGNTPQFDDIALMVLVRE